MGLPASALGDPVTPPPGAPPGVIALGSPTVLVGGKPFSALGDATVFGPIIMGNPLVLVGGKPAARLGDPHSGPGVIVMGNPTVLA